MQNMEEMRNELDERMFELEKLMRENHVSLFLLL